MTFIDTFETAGDEHRALDLVGHAMLAFDGACLLQILDTRRKRAPARPRSLQSAGAARRPLRVRSVPARRPR